MKRIKITETQIVQLLKQHEQGIKVADLCRGLDLQGTTNSLVSQGITEGQAGISRKNSAGIRPGANSHPGF
ncbi:MAG: hypothetical protein ACK5XP_00830 [Sphingobacteriia bacterium]